MEHDDDEMVQMMMEFSRAAQAWERFLFASGGILALHKCFCWLVGWRWENGMPVLTSNTYLDVSLYLENGNDDAKCKIRSMGPAKANMGIGFRMTPSGIQDKEVEYRKEQSDNFASRFNAQISRLMNHGHAMERYTSQR